MLWIKISELKKTTTIMFTDSDIMQGLIKDRHEQIKYDWKKLEKDLCEQISKEINRKIIRDLKKQWNKYKKYV